MKNDKIKAFFNDLRMFFQLLFAHPMATFKWLWAHRTEPNNRAKRRRMDRDVRKGVL